MHPDEVLYKHGDLDLKVYMIIYGTLELLKTALALSSAEAVGIGRYTIGTFVGEEWIYNRKYYAREETCKACESACVLELNVNSFELIR